MNFWNTLLTQGSIIGLSPMDGVTDLPMRYMVAKYGRPQVIYTEFVSVDGLTHAKNPESVDRLMGAFLRLQEIGGLKTYPYQVAQVFGHDPELFYTAAVIVATLGYDGMDINMGCPAKNVSERGSGAGLIRTPEVAQEIVRQAKKGIADWSEGKVTIDDLNVSEEMKEWVMRHAGQSLSILASSSLGQKLRFQETKKLHHDSIPVSVKTRLGVDSIVVEDWMRALMEVEPAMITLHGRTLKQLYQGEANWEEIGKAAQVVHSLGGHILGNGDIQSLDDLHSKIVAYGVDGGLIGRASEGNPGIFTGTDNPTWDERKAWMLEHAKLFEKVFGPDRFIPMRKHLAWYCKDFPGASEMRGQLVRCSNVSQLYGILS